MNRLFVYGIFLEEMMRNSYGMTEPEYAVVLGFKTIRVGGEIVEAIPDVNGALTGLLVTVAPQSQWLDYQGKLNVKDNWQRLDQLEAGYKRITIKTIGGDTAYMYAGKEHRQDESKQEASSFASRR